MSTRDPVAVRRSASVAAMAAAHQLGSSTIHGGAKNKALPTDADLRGGASSHLSRATEETLSGSALC